MRLSPWGGGASFRVRGSRVRRPGQRPLPAPRRGHGAAAPPHRDWARRESPPLGAEILPENSDMQHLCARLGFALQQPDDPTSKRLRSFPEEESPRVLCFASLSCFLWHFHNWCRRFVLIGKTTKWLSSRASRRVILSERSESKDLLYARPSVEGFAFSSLERNDGLQSTPMRKLI